MFNNEKQRFSLRKLSVGLASVCIGITFISVKQDTVKADTIDAKTNIVTAQSVNPDVQKADTQKELLKNTDTQDGVKQTEPIDKTSDSNTPRDLGTNGVAKENIAVSEQLENKENIGNNVKDVNNTKQNELHVSTGDNQLNSTHENKQALETSLLKDTNKPETTNTFHVRKSNIQANINALRESKAVDPNTNGGFDEATWGKLDVNDWKGSVQGDYYQLTDYTGNANHVIVPNEADFAKAGISTSGKQVGVTSNLMHTIFKNKDTATDATVAFSKTDNKQVKAIGNDWSVTWYSMYDGKLSKFDGTNIDVSNVTDMSYMFSGNQINDLSTLANWNVSNVTNMESMFYQNQISDLSPLANWKVSNVTNMETMFSGNQISDLSPLANWKVSNVTNMRGMFSGNQISDLSPLANWKVSNVTNMGAMFSWNMITDLNPLANWKVDNVTNMRGMFYHNQISDVSPLANWNVAKVTNIRQMFDANSSTQTTTVQAKLIINFVYPANYLGKKQNSITQTVDVPTKQVQVELTTKDSKPSNNILDWVTKTETPISTPTDPVYFQDYTVPEIKGLLEPDKTVVSRQQADIAKPINVTVTYKLVDSNTNDAFALDSKNGLHEHANVNDNGGYDADFWGKINVDDWDYTVNDDRIEINGLKDGASTGTNDAVIVPNLDDFKLAGKDGGAKTVYISKNTLSETNWHKYYGLSKTNGNKFATDSDISSVFDHDRELTHADFNSLDTGNVTGMYSVFGNASSLKSLDVSNWDTGNVTNMCLMFYGTSSLTSLDVSKWNTSNVTNMGWMFRYASNLTSLDVSNWDTSKVTDMSEMFEGASRLTSLDVSNWDTSKVTDMSEMFNGASSLTSLDVSNWKTSKVTDMIDMFNDASSLTNLDVSNWDTSNVTYMSWMFHGASSLALIVNDDKFADYLVKNNFANSAINSDVKSVTTDNTKLLKLLTNDIGKSESATRTIVFTFPAGYSPDLTKYHLTKTGNTYQIKQSADYDKPYVQGTVLINATDDITKHHIDTTKLYQLSDTWQPNYDKLVLAHKNSDGSVSFDAIQLPKVPGYKARINNPNVMLFSVSFMALPKPVTPVQNDAKPAKTVATITTTATEVAKPIKTEPKVATTLKVIDLSDDAVSTTPKETTWQVANNLEHDTYYVSNGKYTVELPHISNAQLHVIANDSTKDSVLFTYKGQNTKYVFNIKFVNGHYLLTTYKIKSGKLVKLIDCNFVKSSKMIEVILDWLKR